MDFIDFDLPSDYKIHEIQPNDLPPTFSCHAPPGPFVNAGVDPPARKFLDYYNSNVSVPEENWTNTSISHIRIGDIAEALTRLDSQKTISCVSLIFARVTGLSLRRSWCINRGCWEQWSCLLEMLEKDYRQELGQNA